MEKDEILSQEDQMDGWAFLMEKAGYHSIRKFQNKNLDFCIRESIRAMKKANMMPEDLNYKNLSLSGRGWATYTKWRNLGYGIDEVQKLLRKHWDR